MLSKFLTRWSTGVRLGLTAKTVLIISTVACMAVGASVLTSRAFERMHTALDRLSTTELEQLMTSVRLVQQSESMVSLGINLAQARTHDERRRTLVELQDRAEWMRKVSRDLPQIGESADIQSKLRLRQNEFAENLQRLDDAVRDKIDGEPRKGLEASIRRLVARNQEVAGELSVLMGYYSATSRRRLAEQSAQLANEARRQQHNLWTLAACLLIVVTLSGLYFERRVVRRILRLQRSLSAEHPNPAELILSGADELAHLSSNVSEYVRRVQAQELRLKRINDDLAFLAEHDPLTQLPNRRHFGIAAGRLFQRSAMPVCVAIGDIDHFKAVNDRNGHATGDLSLVHVAAQMQAGVRTQDVLARFGGEEFAIVLPVPKQQEAHEILERIRRTVADRPLKQPGASPVAMTISFGAVMVDVPSLGADVGAAARRMLLERALHVADEALYEAKRNGRNRVCFAEQHLSLSLGTSKDQHDN